MSQIAIHYSAIAACSFILVACICRIDLMRAKRNRWDWCALYVCFAAYALGTLLTLLRGGYFAWADLAGIGGVVLYMCLTRRLWANGAPPETVRGGLEQVPRSEHSEHSEQSTRLH